MTSLQDIRRTLHQGQAEASAGGAATRTPRATPRVSKASGKASGTVLADETTNSTKSLIAPPRATPRASSAVSADETTKSLVAPTRKWLAEGSKKANSDNHRKLYKLMNTDGARLMAKKWYDEVASLGEDRAWSEDTIQKYFKLVSKSAEQAANEESGGTHADGKKGKEANKGRKKAADDSTRKRATPEDHQDADPEAIAVARKARRIRIVSDDDDE
ncbi:hypothetical protein KC316_g2514 [Hortaea werneckii]|nr:hypothetical protein KC324_g2502 [Hortaea werneckii]KAI7592069.1 hypothetical protein KC316_g2514 [Hortaea werneckii]